MSASLPPNLSTPLHALPRAPYAVAVSGGADSVALLHLLHHHRSDCPLHVVHLDHQTRGPASAADADFVLTLSQRFNLPITTTTRSVLESRLTHKTLPPNPSARYRALRHELFREVVTTHRLEAVLLAHHADDQAETVLHRLLRGSHVPHLTGMAPDSRLGDLRLLRPLLPVRRKELRDYLASVNQPWREDASNASDDYLRNRLRRLLASRPDLVPALLRLHDACTTLRAWIRTTAPTLPDTFPPESLAQLPKLLATESARRWLIAHAVAPNELTPPVLDRLLTMAADAASPPRQDFPGPVTVRRHRGHLSAHPKQIGRR